MAAFTAEELYLTSSTGEELQFCYMRPSAEELCPELPFMIAGPPITLDSFGVPTRLLSMDDLPPLLLASDDAPSPSTRPVMPVSAAAEALERALTSSEPLLGLGELQAGDWRDLFQSPRAESALAAASPTQLQRLASEGGSETLADLLLHHTLPRLLGRSAASQPQQPHQPPQPQEQEVEGHEPTALPREMAELLTALLRAGSLRRCAPTDFDASVLLLHRLLHRLRTTSVPSPHHLCTASAPPLHPLCTLSAGTRAPTLASTARKGGSDAGLVLLRVGEAGRGAGAGAKVP